MSKIITSKLTVIATASVLACAIFASSANAGTYSVTQCHGGTGAGLSPQWSTQLNGSWAATNVCTAGVQVATNGLDGVYALYTMYLPTGLTINSVTFGSQGLGATSIPVYAMLCGSNAIPICNWLPNGVIDLNQSSAVHSMTAPGATMFRIGVGSTPFTHYTGTAYASIWNMAFTLDDSTAPSLGAPTGTLSVSNWNRGNVNVGISGTDGQSGLKSIAAIFDSNPVGPANVSTTPSCSNLNVVPCPTSVSGWTPTLSTGSLADGAHTLRYAATDYADNTTQSSVYNFKVDNTAPAVPGDVQVPGSGGWNSENDFDLSWTNIGETTETATQSGIAAVKVDIEPTTGGQSNPAAVTIPAGTTVGGVSATVSSLANLSVPSQGAWKIKLAVIDKAGNESPVGDGSNGVADSVFDIGFDPNPPAAPEGQANGWISRDELASGFVAQWTVSKDPDDAPICGYARTITDTMTDPGTSITLAGAVTSLTLPSNLTEGEHWVNLRSVSCALVASSSTEHIEAPVDLTDPAGQFSGVEDGGWYSQDVSIGLSGTDAVSGMAPKDPLDQEISNGAYLEYALDGGSASRIAGGNASVGLGAEGTHSLAFAPVDFAGNKAQAKTLSFGIDKSNPTGAFANSNPDRPTWLTAPVADVVSGLKSGTIEIRKQNGGDWQVLPTSIADSAGNAVAGYPNSANVSARFPDTLLPKGTYDVRLRAYDRAGNALITSKRADGSDMTITNPARGGVALSAGLSKAKRTCKKKRGVKCVKKARGKVVFSNTYPALAVGFKRGAVVQGFLTTEKYGALSRQPIEIYAKSKKGAEALLGTTSTRSDGSYVFKIKPGVSRTIRVYYPGTELREDASATVQLGTAAKLKLRASTKHARTGQTVTFSGNVRSFDGSLPAAGKIVALQFYAGKSWRPAVGIAHTDSKGNFKINYKFDGARVKARIIFRVYAPTEDSWDHAASASQRLIVKLN